MMPSNSRNEHYLAYFSLNEALNIKKSAPITQISDQLDDNSADKGQ